jgi:hypothetical protein
VIGESGGDPLRRALAEMREEVDGLLDDALARLAVSDAGDDRTLAPHARPRESRAEQAASLGGHGEASLSRIESKPQRHAERSYITPPTSSLLAQSPRGDAPNDAESRLDALAQRLEGRLKRSRDRGGDDRSTSSDDARPQRRSAGQAASPSDEA